MIRRRLILASMIVAFAAPLLVAAWILLPLPDGLLDGIPVSGVEIVDRHGIRLRTTRSGDGERARWLALDEVDGDVIGAFLATEDQRFFEHHGVDARAVIRAARDNLRRGRIVSGASTISMQLARLVRELPHGWSGKVRQALWAWRLERHLSKQHILEQYLNRVPLGQATRGVAAAADLYFGTDARAVSLGQAALLAGLASHPTYDNPIADAGRARERRAFVLQRLAARGHLDSTALSRVAAEPVLELGDRNPFLAAHYTSHLLTSVDRDSATGGAWRTALDLDLQLELEEEIRTTVFQLSERGAQHAAAVVLDNERGDVLAWVGSPDFWADGNGQVDMVVARRQPGSTLKPFLYAMAVDDGYTAASVLPDVETTYETPAGAYRPRNYDRRFHGPVRVREALASSYNVPAVELTHRFGATRFLETLHRAGFASLAEPAEHYGVGLALGNGDVTLLELANAYRALANQGRWRPHAAHERYDPDMAPAPFDRTVVSARSASLILDILSDPVARIPGFGVRTPFDFPFPVAVKTGTSRRFTDNWAVGVTGGFTVAVWVGNFSGEPMQNVSGVTGAGPLLHKAVMATARRFAPGTFDPVETHHPETHRICSLSGKLATAYCPAVDEVFFTSGVPAAQCDWHGPDGVSLPPEYGEWVTQQASLLQMSDAGHPVTVARTDRFRIVSPLDGDEYQIPPGMPSGRFATIPLRAEGADVVRWWVDGERVDAARWQLEPGRHTVRAVAASGQMDEVEIAVGSGERGAGSRERDRSD